MKIICLLIVCLDTTDHVRSKLGLKSGKKYVWVVCNVPVPHKLVIAQKFVSQFITSYHNSSIFLTFSLSNPSTPPEKWACGDSCKFLLRFDI